VKKYLWKDKKRPFLGLPISFTTYYLTDEKLYIETGLLNLKEEEIRLYRILDVTVTQSFFQRLFNVGTLHFMTADRSTPKLDIVSIKNPKDTKEFISQQAEMQRDEKRVSSREFMGDVDEIE
jgi:uncharacterized membrane protein YdbT with pleckstrin-like domain